MSELKNKCRYAECTNVPRCRRENPDYCPVDRHSENIKTGCNPYREYPWYEGNTNHCWICDEHYRLLEFIRNHVNEKGIV